MKQRCFVRIIFAMVPWMSAFSNQIDTTKTKPKPITYIKTQYAGNLGFLSVGAGRIFPKNNMTLDLNYGYLPKTVNGVRVHTFGLKPAYHFVEMSVVGIQTGFYAGACFTYSITSNTYLKSPDHYPEGYYEANAIHINPFIGAQASFNTFGKKTDRLTLFMELGTVDYKIWYAFHNKGIGLNEIWNVCFGLSLRIKND